MPESRGAGPTAHPLSSLEAASESAGPLRKLLGPSVALQDPPHSSLLQGDERGLLLRLLLSQAEQARFGDTVREALNPSLESQARSLCPPALLRALLLPLC